MSINERFYENDAEAKSFNAESGTATLSHSLNHDKSILALVVSSANIIAGTEEGEMLVRAPSSVCRCPKPNLIVRRAMISNRIGRCSQFSLTMAVFWDSFCPIMRSVYFQVQRIDLST
jgi:hypothetical protein